MDPGMKNYNFQSPFLQRNGKRMWLPSLCKWMDLPHDKSPDRIKEYLAKGYLAHLGGHPEPTFGATQDITPEEAYFHLDSILQANEDEFPELGYVFPDEWSDNANNVYAINNITIHKDSSTVSYRFRGAVDSGATVILNGRAERYWLNDSVIPDTKIRTTPNATLVTLPNLPNGNHSLRAEDFITSVGSDDNQTLNPIHSISLHREKLILFSEKETLVSLYTLQGRNIMQRSIPASEKTVINLRNTLQAGAYIIRVRSGDAYETSQLFHLY
ncbi:MAG: T9SS type A sorting domain-containing protein, partial [Fibrobacterota bacterium]